MNDLDNDMETVESSHLPSAGQVTPGLSQIMIYLLKGVIYREDDERQWDALLRLQARVRELATVLWLDLVLDEAEGYSFFKSRPDTDDTVGAPRMPRLVVRRQLTYAVSLMLALLRKKLAEFDAGSGDTRLVLTRDELVDLVRVFLSAGPNEAKLIDQVDATINKVVDLGFLRQLKPTVGSATQNMNNYEVRRILKSFVDAQWLAEFDAHLETYRTALAGAVRGKDAADE